MGFSISTHNLPRLHDYNGAKRYHDKVAPIRGRTVRPLLNWNSRDRAKWRQFSIRETTAKTPLSSTPVNGVELVLYNTPVVTYFEDGTKRIYTGGYNSQSTAKFINAYLLGWVNGGGGDHLRWVSSTHGTIKINNELWLDNRDNTNKPINPEPFVVHAIDRKAKKEVMKDYAAFMDYAIGLGRLTNWDKPEEAGTPHAHQWRELMQSEDIDDHVRAYKVAVWNCGRNIYGYHNGGWANRWKCNEAMFKRWMTDVVMSEHGDKILVRKELPIGEYKKDPNCRWAKINRMV